VAEFDLSHKSILNHFQLCRVVHAKFGHHSAQFIVASAV
jgi:hypothetical protein